MRVYGSVSRGAGVANPALRNTAQRRPPRSVQRLSRWSPRLMGSVSALAQSPTLSSAVAAATATAGPVPREGWDQGCTTAAPLLPSAQYAALVAEGVVEPSDSQQYVLGHLDSLATQLASHQHRMVRSSIVSAQHHLCACCLPVHPLPPFVLQQATTITVRAAANQPSKARARCDTCRYVGAHLNPWLYRRARTSRTSRVGARPETQRRKRSVSAVPRRATRALGSCASASRGRAGCRSHAQCVCRRQSNEPRWLQCFANRCILCAAPLPHRAVRAMQLQVHAMSD
eukprot:SAG11_NODE_6751_length_1254_cov_1.196537_2_plen_285_part_01